MSKRLCDLTETMRSTFPSSLPPPTAFVPEPLSSVCVTGVAQPANLLTGFLRDFLRQHFSVASNIAEEQLQPYLWNADEKASKILIDSVTRWNPRTPEMRPALLLKRNSTKVEPVTIGNRIHGYKTAVDGTIDISARFEAQCLCSFTTFCVARTGAEAEALGAEVFLSMLEFAPVVLRELNLLRFAPMEMGAVNMLEESHQHWVLPVPVAAAFSHAWSLRQQAPLIKAATIVVE